MLGRVYTNDPVWESETWRKHTVALPLRAESEGPVRVYQAWRNALVVDAAAGSDDLVIMSDTHNLSGSLYGLLRGIRGRRPTFVRTDPLLTTRHLPLLDAGRDAYLRTSLQSVDRIIVWAPPVMERYAAYFGIPREKMVAQRFHNTLRGYQYETVMGEYVFSGGDSMRDYLTLIEAVRRISVKVFIATRWRPPSGYPVPENVTIKAVSQEEFRYHMASARMVVFPLRIDSIRTAGQQSYLNAMAMGKPVVVTDTVDAPYYIEHGKTGLLVGQGSSAALGEAIRRLLEDRQLAGGIAEAARAYALPLDQEYTWSNVLRLALAAHEDRVQPAELAGATPLPAKATAPVSPPDVAERPGVLR